MMAEFSSSSPSSVSSSLETFSASHQEPTITRTNADVQHVEPTQLALSPLDQSAQSATSRASHNSDAAASEARAGSS